MRIVSGILPGQVLQRTPRGATATVRGTAAVDGPVTATISAQGKALRGWAAKVVGKAAKGAFSATLKGLPTGGPYRLELVVGGKSGSGTAKATLSEFFVGDVWLMAGQSNMEGCGNLDTAPKPHPLVRNFTMGRYWELAHDPLHHLAESPDTVHNASGKPQSPEEAYQAKRARTKGAGVGVWFGRLLVERTGGVPQGLIATAHGGTSMQQWDPTKRDQGGASLYGSMILSLQAAGQPVAGMLWYQGCSETGPEAAPLYTQRMIELVAAVRRDLRQPKLPWITVQIARVVGNPAGGLEWNSIQEQQRLLPTKIKHLETVAAIDLELDDLIHVSGRAYAQLGERMARAAARLALGDRSEAPAPQLVSVLVSDTNRGGPAIEVRYRNVGKGLQSTGLPAGFTFVDPQHQPVDLIFKTVLEHDRAVLYLTSFDRNDLRLMYGHGRNPFCNITDSRGYALPVFGPLPVYNAKPLSPFLATWDVSGILDGEAIAKLPQPTAKNSGPLTRKAWADRRFTNQHEVWTGKSGHAAFFGELTLDQAMDLELRFGYDGPVRLWIGNTEVFRDLNGINPAITDAKRKKLSLKAGTHKVTVLMSLNGGMAWGFFLRFARLGAKRGDNAVPSVWA